jgi:hypothetical protein
MQLLKKKILACVVISGIDPNLPAAQAPRAEATF